MQTENIDLKEKLVQISLNSHQNEAGETIRELKVRLNEKEKASEYQLEVLQLESRKTIEQLEEKIKTVLPTLMRREGIDMWVVLSRE